MIKVLCLREVPEHENEGIDKHCHALYDMFREDKEINILPIKDAKGVVYIKRLSNRQYYKWNDLKKTIKDSGCDIVHVHGFASFLAVQSIIMAKLCGKKIIYTAHYHPIETLDNPTVGKLFFYFMLKPVLCLANGFIALNNEDRIFIGKYIKKVYQIPHWMRLNVKDVSLSEKKSNMILFVGRNKGNKGVDHLLQLPRNKYEVHCVCGDTTIDRDDFILHHDISNDELSNLYAKASLLVVPSKYEAFSLVALEAFMHKTPVLMSDRVRIADYLEGCSGYTVFKYGDYDAFNSAIESAKQQIVDVKSIIERFEPDRIKQMYVEAYKSL